jgi:hypothetical protein
MHRNSELNKIIEKQGILKGLKATLGITVIVVVEDEKNGR